MNERELSRPEMRLLAMLERATTHRRARELADELGTEETKVNTMLRFLRDAGLIAEDRRTVLVAGHKMLWPHVIATINK